MKKRMMAMLMALMLLLPHAGAVTAAQVDSFPDVPKSAYYYDAVEWALENNITQGMGDGQFQPNSICNRAQVVTFLWRLDGKPAVSGKNTFTDVQKGSWYADPVLWAMKEKVTDGMGEGLFEPYGTCNRAQIVTFLWKYAGKPKANVKAPFTDVRAGSWYAEAVAWAVEEGITVGMSKTTFGPEQPCNRAQVVTFLYRYATDPEWGMGGEDF
ncbi:MAG: S-layer homology domain-containing protein [Oscillospiraceae bacterium]|nr:S-layer homology domain-containing protein [Oscillospiraceae bacterium]